MRSNHRVHPDWERRVDAFDMGESLWVLQIQMIDGCFERNMRVEESNNRSGPCSLAVCKKGGETSEVGKTVGMKREVDRRHANKTF